MKEMIVLEFNNCIKRKEFKFVLSILMIISIGSYLIACFKFFGSPLSFVRSAYETGMIQGLYSRFLINVEFLLLPLLAMIIYSDSYYLDSKLGVTKTILTRVDRKAYIVSKAVVVFVVTFLVFFLPLLLNQLLSLIAFPIEGFDNNNAFPPFDIGIQKYSKDVLFDFLRLQSPLTYNVIYMTIVSLFSALLALFGYSLFFIFRKNNKFSITIGMFLLYIIMDIAFNFMGLRTYSIYYYLNPRNAGSLLVMILWILVLGFSSIFLIIKYGFNGEEIEI